MKLSTLTLFIFICFLQPLFAQSAADSLSFEEIESSIRAKKMLFENNLKLDQLYKYAEKKRDVNTMSRALYNKMLIRDLRSEDSSYFKNSAFIDTLLRSKESSAKLKAIMHVMQAKRLSIFNYKYLRFKRDRYQTPGLISNYAAFDKKQMDSVVQYHLGQAFLLSAKLKVKKGEDLKWLSSSPDVFLFSPGLSDIVFTERINHLRMIDQRDYASRDIWKIWVGFSSETFFEKLDSISGVKDDRNLVLKSYHAWRNSHLKNPEKAAYIGTLVRKYIYQFNQHDTLVRKQYLKYLESEVASSYDMVRAHTVYQLCLLWNSEGTRYRYSFDQQYQFLPLKALTLYEDNKNLMKRYGLLDKVLKTMCKQILLKSMALHTSEKSTTTDSIFVHISYKNTPKIFYRIIKSNVSNYQNNNGLSAAERLLEKPFLREVALELPLPADHNDHATIFKVNGLENGHYYLVFSDEALRPDARGLNFISFSVTDLAAVNTDERVYILDRNSGLPKENAQVAAYYYKRGLKGERTSVKEQKQILKVNKEGYVMVNKALTDQLLVASPGDTLIHDFGAYDVQLPRNVYNKEDYDNLEEFYETQAVLRVYTDKGIYRPGQTLYFKAILLTKNPKTGANALWEQKEPDTTKLYIQDPFGKKVDSLKITFNSYGSYSGSFIIPKTGATGAWKINTKYLRYSDDGNFQVEEYKRPSYELSLEQPKKTLKPGDAFSWKVGAKSFSGASLNNIPIHYTVIRSGRSVVPSGSLKSYRPPNENVSILDTTVHANERGEIEIAVADSSLKKRQHPTDQAWNYTYQLKAEAVEATGEKVELSGSVNVSTRPYRINTGVKNVYDRQNLSDVTLSVLSELEGIVPKKVKISIYRTGKVKHYVQSAERTDQDLYSKEQLDAWFPGRLQVVNQTQPKVLIFETMLNTADVKKFSLPKDRLGSGDYELTAECIDKDQRDTLTGQSTYSFKVFDTGNGTVPDTEFSYLAFNQVKPGDEVRYYTAASNAAYCIYQLHYYSHKKDGLQVVKVYKELRQAEGLQEFVFTVPADAVEKLLLTKVYVHQSEIYEKEETLYVIKSKTEEPEIIIERYRKIMAPGARETFSLSIKAKNEQVAAELMTTLYDASLDKLKKHSWSKPAEAHFGGYISTSWPHRLNSEASASLNFYRKREVVISTPVGDGPPQGFGSIEGDALAGRMAGLSMANTQGLNEVVVVGYGIEQKKSLVGSVVQIRGNASLSAYSQPLIILDGVIFQGDLNSLQAASLSEVMVLKGAEASALYGSRAANGVLIISTNGPIKLPGDQNEPVVKIRKDFKETAFFFPNVYAGKDGRYTFSFTMPETATSWNWKMLAHTKSALFAYAEHKLTTQLSLMVQPNMPRLLYQGDEINLQSRISNLDTLALEGKVRLKIEDVVTGEDLTAKLVAIRENEFKAGKKLTTNSSFLIKVPKEQLNPLKIVVSAISGSYSDAEEHVIPVLGTKVFVRDNRPLRWTKESDTVLKAAALPADAKFYGLALSIQPKPQAALMNSLPSLANYSFDCAEQSFNKLLAQVTALQLMQTDSLVRKSWSKAMKTKAMEDKNMPAPKRGEQLPDELATLSMPWLNLDTKNRTQQEQLIKLLDTVASKAAINKHLEKLYQLQNKDGGLAWFDGGQSNAYISNYVLAGFGKIWGGSWRKDIDSHLPEFIKKLVEYADVEFNKPKQQAGLHRYILPDDLFYAYGRSFWLNNPNETKIDQLVETKIRTQLSEKWKHNDQSRLSQQAMLIITTMRYFSPLDKEYNQALKQLESIRQLAIEDTWNGIRWKDIADADDISSSAEETIALIAEAFDESKLPAHVAIAKHVHAGLVKWLLQAKSEHSWQTTKATAAAIDLLKREKGSVVAAPQSLSTKIDDKQLLVSDDMLSGSPFQFVRMAVQPASLTFQKQDGQPAMSQVSYYYFTNPDQLEGLNKAVSLRKKLYRFVASVKENKPSANTEDQWKEIEPGTSLEIGERIKVVLSVQTAKELRFIYIDDKRSAAFEPKDKLSGRQFQDGVSYYRSIRDAGMQIFTEFIPSGKSDISYELTVAREGIFEKGAAVLQAMYQPAVTAYSNSGKVIVTKQ
jgi:TonB-dependent SusC/RagA subfamily outer membrane receptor